MVLLWVELDPCVHRSTHVLDRHFIHFAERHS
uniref:Uncharacterized protein n=1 Tax=Arundo donax TaxID=35708 RepID=A0A0A9SPD6_ARUDO